MELMTPSLGGGAQHSLCMPWSDSATVIWTIGDRESARQSDFMHGSHAQQALWAAMAP